MSEWIRVKDELPRTNDLGIAHVLVYDKKVMKENF